MLPWAGRLSVAREEIIMLKSVRRFGAFLAFVASLATPAAAQVTDYLGIPGPIEFDGQAYGLAWSSQPGAQYTKQEYVPEGQAVERYEQKVLVETVRGNLAVMDAVRIQVETLNQRKENDPLVNMGLVQNEATGEALLDFIVSSKDDAGEYTVEWNAYRYSPLKTAEGDGVLLFAISRRAYGNDNVRSFLESLKDVRPGQVNALASAPLPELGR